MSFRAETVPQDWQALAAWLAARGLMLDVSWPPRQFAGGLANLNYLVQLFPPPNDRNRPPGGESATTYRPFGQTFGDDGTLSSNAGMNGAPAVFRRPPSGPLAHGASDMGREARVLAALARHFPLAPRLLAFCDDPSIIGVPFQLLEWRPGGAVGGDLPDGFDATAHRWMIPEIARVLADLHARDPAAVGLADLARPEGFAARQLKGWTRRAEAAFGLHAPPTLATLLRQLGTALPTNRPARLLHMDPKFDNLLLDAQSRSATALIDWDMATLGPPAFDLAVLLSYWIEPSDPPAVHALHAVPSLAPGWPGRAAVVQAYEKATGALPPDLGWHLALARLRLATAWMQLYRLWQQGGLQGERYAGFQRLADAILQQAVEQFGDMP